ncbi:MAG: hypothetical protein AB7E29_11325 [Xanthobacter sp.]
MPLVIYGQSDFSASSTKSRKRYTRPDHPIGDASGILGNPRKRPSDTLKHDTAFHPLIVSAFVLSFSISSIDISANPVILRRKIM